MSRAIDSNTEYGDKLIKLIPVEIVAAYLAIQDAVVREPGIREITLYSSAFILTLLIPFYLRFLHGVTSMLQIVVTMISFLVWAYSVSVIFLTSLNFHPVSATVLLILWTTVIPVIRFGDEGEKDEAI